MTAGSITDVLHAAVRCHNAGQWQQAEQLYRQILQADPRHAQATYLLGLMAYQLGKHDVAIKILSHAIRLDGGQAIFHSTLGEAFRSLGKMADAVASYRQALRLNPDYAEAHNNLGTLYESLGNAPAAEACYREAIRLSPVYADPYHNLGNALQQQGRLDEAAAEYAAAVRIKPDYPSAQVALASVLQTLGRADEAQLHFEAVLKAHPNSPQVHSTRGAGYQGSGDHETAIACYRRAIELDPSHANAHYNLGTALQYLGRDLEAVAAYQEALRHNPRMALAWSNLANVCVGLVRPDEAAFAARKAQQLQPRSGSVMAKLAGALQLQGDMGGAIAAYRGCVELEPNDSANHSNLIYTLNFHPGNDDWTLFAEHRAWAERHAERLTAAAALHANDRSSDRRLRVGYVSGHFRHHAVAFFAEPLLAAHDREQIELYCYADLRHADATTERFRGRADAWRDITRLGNQEAAELVRADEIDILVDLDGHIGGNRLLVFAYKPAPVQVTYLGYQNTTGMTAMDYRLTDAHADPPGETDRWYTERLVRLPGAFLLFCSAGAGPRGGAVAGGVERVRDVCLAEPYSQAYRRRVSIVGSDPQSRARFAAAGAGILAGSA